MQAEIFYAIETDNTCPLTLLSEDSCAEVLSALSTGERNSLALQQFKGCLGDVGFVSDASGILCRVYIGSGDGSVDAEALAYAVNALPKGAYRLETPVSESAMVAWALAQYRFDKYKTCKELPRTLAIPQQESAAVLSQAAAIFLVRDLINRPANDLDPLAIAEVVLQLAKENGALFHQWVGDALLCDNFPAIHAVGRAACQEPRLLSLLWGDEKHPRVTLIGKGVCFDSGGLDIKPSVNMRLMKKDMGGAAHAIGLAKWLMERRVPIRLHVLIPAVENAVGSRSYRPGDVLTMRNGLTVEIDNTDAEGRLVLADALVKACEEEPELIIDFATLTGGARVAVGTEIAAMFTNDDELAAALEASSKETKDPLWRMPLYEGYASMLDSSIADMVNASPSSYASAITAALFLQRFVTKDVPWVHFDIMAWNLSTKPGKPEGGEAMGIKAVGRYLMQRYS